MLAPGKLKINVEPLLSGGFDAFCGPLDCLDRWPLKAYKLPCSLDLSIFAGVAELGDAGDSKSSVEFCFKAYLEWTANKLLTDL